MAGETSAQFGQTIDFVICFHSKCALKRRSARDHSLKSTLGGSSAKLRVDGDFSPVGKIQRCRLDDRLWRLNGTWSQSLAPDEARSPPHLESSGGIAQKQTLWAIVSGQTASRLRQLLALSPIAFCPTDSDRTKYLWMQFFNQAKQHIRLP